MGLALRGVAKGYVPPTAFMVISLAATAILLIGWRTVAAAVLPAADDPTLTPAQRALKTRRDKQGNPLEFLSLLQSLTKRW